MRRMWPEEFSTLLDGAEEVTLQSAARDREDGSHSEAIHRRALKVRMTQADYERIWPLAEARYRAVLAVQPGDLVGQLFCVLGTSTHGFHRTASLAWSRSLCK